MSGRPWNDDEVHLLRSMYSRIGPEELRIMLLAKGFKRTTHSIQNKAHRLGLVSGISRGHMSLNEALEIILGYPSISHRARTQWRRFFMDNNLITYNPNNKVKWTVKEDVVYEIADRIAEDNDMKHSGEWFTITEAAKKYNVDPSYLRRCLIGKHSGNTLMARQMKNVRARRTFLQSHWYLNAEDVKKSVVEYERIQHAKKQEKTDAQRRLEVLQVRVQDRSKQGRHETTNGDRHARVE